MDESKNLWSADLLKLNDQKLPVSILHEQARYLNEMTKNIVTAQVDSTKVAISQGLGKDPKPGILHSLKIIAPAIGNYEFELLRIVQKDFLPYPINVYSPLTEEKFEINDERGLIEVLLSLFNNKKTITTLQNLYLQSTSSSLNE